MADERHGASFRNEVVFNMGGEFQRQLEEANKAIERLTTHKEFSEYWKSQESLINDVNAALQRFQQSANTDTSRELIQTHNALKAIADTDMSNLISDFDRVSEAYKRAVAITPDAASAFSADNFRSVFAYLNDLSDKVPDIGEKLKGMFASADANELRRQINELNRDLIYSQDTISGLRDRLRELGENSRVGELEEQVRRLESALESTRTGAVTEFQRFLSTNDIASYDSRAIDYIEQLQRGYITAKEAIADFRASYADVLNEGSADGFNTAQVDKFRATLDEINAKLDEALARLNNVGSGGGLEKLNGEMEKGAQFSTAEAQSIKALSEVIERLENSSGTASERMQTMTALMKSIGDIGESSMRNLSSAMMNIVNMGGEKFSAKPIENLATALGAFKGVENSEYLAALSRLRFDGLKELTVSKAALDLYLDRRTF